MMAQRLCIMRLESFYHSLLGNGISGNLTTAVL